MGIYVAKNSEQLGPFDIEALAKAVFGQEISLTDLAWTDGESDWIQLKELASKRAWNLEPQHPPKLPTGAASSMGTAMPPPPPAPVDQWIVRRSGQEYGPYSKQNMRDFVKSGNLLTSDEVRHVESMDFSPLVSILGNQGFDFNAVAVKAGDVFSGVGTRSVDFASTAFKKAGPTGALLLEKIKRKEKIVGGVFIGIVVLLGIVFTLSGGPSTGDIKDGLQRELDEKLNPATSAFGAKTKVSGIKHLECKSADKGGYYCNFEAELEASNTLTGQTATENRPFSARFIKDSKGWSAVLN